MVPMSFTEPDRAAKDYLLMIAKQAIEQEFSAKGANTEENLPLLPDDFKQLNVAAATFVTLKGQFDALRGCIGTLEAKEAAYLSVYHNAKAAAFKDPRFPAVTKYEWPMLKVSISLLSESVNLKVSSETELRDKLRAGVDGLILEEQGRSATFLPSVWENIPEKIDFIQHLKSKAGLDKHYWSDSIRFKTYQSFNF